MQLAALHRKFWKWCPQIDIQCGTAACSADVQDMIFIYKIYYILYNTWLVECCTETIGLLGTGALDSHLDFHTALEF